MKKAEVKIGGKYYANVSGNPLRDSNRCREAAWRLGRDQPRDRQKDLIKSAQRLQGEVGAKRGRAKVTTEVNVTVVENEPATVETIGGDRPQQLRFSRSHARQRLHHRDGRRRREAIELRRCGFEGSQRIERANERSRVDHGDGSQGLLDSPGGKTPHATLYSAILRDLAKGDDSKFVKTERGRFTVRG